MVFIISILRCCFNNADHLELEYEWKSILRKAFESNNIDVIKRTYRLIFNNYKNLLFSISYSITNNNEDSEDCVQEIFLSFFNKGTEILSISNIKYYLVNAVKFSSFKLLRNRVNVVEFDADSLSSYDCYSNIGEGIIGELRKFLTKEELTILVEKIINEKTFKEIASELKSTINKVSGIYFRAKMKAKMKLGESYYEFEENNK